MADFPLNRQNTEKGWGDLDRPWRGVGFDVPALFDIWLIEENLLYPLHVVSRK